MLKNLRSKIESKRHSSEIRWLIFVVLKDFLWFVYNIPNLSFKIILRYFRSMRRNLIMKKLIRGKRVLIIGSGPSAKNLKKIPDDVLVFTCKLAVKLFAEKNLGKIDLYFNYGSAIKRDYDHLIKYFPKTKVGFFLTDDIDYVKTKKEFFSKVPQLISDSGQNNYYLKRLIKPYNINQIMGRSLAPHASSGMRLLQYALFFKAKEIYLIGVDLGNSGHFYGGKFKWRHQDIDENFMKIVSKKYKNIYSASKNSPITKYIKYKKLE